MCRVLCAVQCSTVQCIMCSLICTWCSVRSIVTSELSPLPGDWFVACAAAAAAAPPAPPAAAPVAAPPPAAPPSLQAAAQLHLISQSSAGRHAVPLAPSLLPSKEQEFPLHQSNPISYLLGCQLLAPLVAPRKLGEGGVCAVSTVAGQLCRHREEQGQEAGGEQMALRSTHSHLVSTGLRLLAPYHPF